MYILYVYILKILYIIHW